jgi:Ras-related protein Rab-28
LNSKKKKKEICQRIMSSEAPTKPVDEEEEDIEQLQFKIIVLGDGAVGTRLDLCPNCFPPQSSQLSLCFTGKTSICTRYTEDSFGKSYKQTIGCDFFVKHIVLPGL